MMKALKSTLLIAAVFVPIAFVSEKAQAYESWEIPFSNETFNAPTQREQGGQEYGNNWCQGVWNDRSSWSPYVASVDGRQIDVISVNHIWYHWNNRQCIANVNSYFNNAPESNNVWPIFRDSPPPQASLKSQEVVTLFVQDSDLNYNCTSVYGSQAYLSESRVANPDLFVCKAPIEGTFTFSWPPGATTSPGESVEKPALSKKYLCGNAAINANGGDRSNITDWRYDGSSNQCYMTINVFQ